MTEVDIKPGSFGLSRIGGVVGFFVWLGQLLSGDASKWTHAWFVLDNGEVIEAEPGGAKIRPIADRLKHKEIVISDLPVRKQVDSTTLPLMVGAKEFYEARLRENLVAYARQLEGVKYNYLNYLSLGLLALGIKPKWLRHKVANNKALICSQLVDFVYTMNGIHIFADGRVPMDVTPGDLARYIKESSKL